MSYRVSIAKEVPLEDDGSNLLREARVEELYTTKKHFQAVRKSDGGKLLVVLGQIWTIRPDFADLTLEDYHLSITKVILRIVSAKPTRFGDRTHPTNRPHLLAMSCK